ncbi:5-formyltetrahydrofolate cyclo-ligase [Xylanimonas allomyrinae]|uniref:5-formyltetrahydrofolate cyclo-ligase n=1 Tax=Xylanimonas allomyrinae TaxID=2509459 RepID=UPI00319E8958
MRRRVCGPVERAGHGGAARAARHAGHARAAARARRGACARLGPLHDRGRPARARSGAPPEPGGPALGASAIATADVVVAPALAVDTRGRRLGQGGGWYDRVLRLVPEGVSVVAMVFADEVYDAEERPLPTEPHDVRVHAVATPQWWRPLTA